MQTVLLERTLRWITELNVLEDCNASHFERLSRSIKLLFTRHEAWTLKTARKVPLLSLFLFGTLWIWGILPMIPIGILAVVLFEKAGTVGVFVNMLLAIGAMAIIIPWYFRWYFICASLMIGRTRLAQSKEDEILERFKRLTSPNAREKST